MFSVTPALFSASKAMPALIAPSPITAIEWRFDPWLRAATAMPSAAEIDVDECAVPKVSYSLSERARETRDPAVLPQVRHPLAPAREDLVRVGLVADVPHQAIVGRVEHVVQRDGQLDGAEVRTEVPARLRDRLEQVAAQLDGQLLQLGAIEAPQVSRRRHALEQFVHPSFRRFSVSGTP